MKAPNSLLNAFIYQIDASLRTLFPPPERHGTRPSPADNIQTTPLQATEKKHVAGLIRVNHAGEVCAQALYRAQALLAQSPTVQAHLAQAAEEETDHLAWCEQRLNTLDSKPSLLNPFWYKGAFCIGLLAGFAGDPYSLGFVVETENQVSAHLDKHLSLLPKQDTQSRAILEHMLADEQQHAHTAVQAGGIALPPFIQKMMGIFAKVMTTSSYYL